MHRGPIEATWVPTASGKVKANIACWVLPRPLLLLSLALCQCACPRLQVQLLLDPSSNQHLAWQQLQGHALLASTGRANSLVPTVLGFSLPAGTSADNLLIPCRGVHC